jgi:hypothetical protein
VFQNFFGVLSQFILKICSYRFALLHSDSVFEVFIFKLSLTFPFLENIKYLL